MDISNLIERNLIKQISNEEGIKNNNIFYVGFDPTANSLHVGHLLPLITMLRLKQSGANPIAVIGGATARIGDPTGRTSSRPILTEEELESNITNITKQIKNIVGCDVVNNKNFVQSNFIDFVSDIGRHFSVGEMIKTDTFKTKLEHGLSFLEFSYTLLQANDFLQLSRNNNCFVQVGGNDQWANMVAGIHLIHAKDKKQAFCFTLPILEDKNKNKFGKSNGNAVWLDSEKTSPFDFWQFWRNVDDEILQDLFKQFSFLPIRDIIAKFNKNTIWSLEHTNLLSGKEINLLKEELATEITGLVHGQEIAKECLNKSRNLFSNSIADSEPEHVFESSKLVSEILKEIGFASSRSEALRLIKQNAVKVNGNLIQEDILLKDKNLIEKGKKNKTFILVK